jgi:hypothetical protein
METETSKIGARTKKRYVFPLYKKRLSHPHFLQLGPWALGTDPYNKEIALLGKAWGVLTEKGLASYANDYERAKVSIRAIAIALMYLDFCWHLFDEANDEPAILEWAGRLELDSYQVVPLYNERIALENPVEDLEDDDEDTLRELILELANEARNEVFDALVAGFGDEESFFESLVAIHGHDADRALDTYGWFSEKMYQFREYC